MAVVMKTFGLASFRTAFLVAVASQLAQLGESDTRGNPPRPPSVRPPPGVPPPIRPPWEGVYGDGPSCPLRNKCNHPDSLILDYAGRNCFCDTMCEVYGDCCRDYVRPQGVPPPPSIPRSAVSCRQVDEIDPDAEINIVDSCPREYTDKNIKDKCENKDLTEMFYQMPVSSKTTGILYRNFDCALCAGETEVTFWSVRVECGDDPWANKSVDPMDVVHNIVKPEKHEEYMCDLKYYHPNATTRKCKSNVGKCDRNWTDRKVQKKCKSHNAYMYVGRITFRNKYCAVCNHVNETYLKCTDPKYPHGDFGEPEGLPPPFSILLDVNTGSGELKEHRVGRSGAKEDTKTVVSVRQCPEYHVYDPFAEVCRMLFCRGMFEIVNGECLAKPTPLPDALNPLSTHPPLDYDGIQTNGVGSRNDSEESEMAANYQDSGEEWLDCPFIRLNSTEYFMVGNGSIYVYNQQQIYNLNQYFIDEGVVYICTPYLEQNYTVKTNMTHRVVMFKFDKIQGLISLIGIIISLLGLLIHLVVYLLLPPLRNIPGKCIICLVVSLFVGQLLFLVGTDRDEVPEVCLTLAALLHYVLLAAFFWMNVLAVDIFRTFSSRSILAQSGGNSRRFLWYSIYAWSTPAVIVGLSLAMDLVLVEHVEEIYRPNYGEQICWITRRYALLFLFALPLAILVAVNIILYIITVRNLILIGNDTKIVQTKNKEKSRLLLYIKLSFIMGLTWVFGFLASLTEYVVLWYVFIAFNTLQGAFICIAFVCNRKVFKLLRDKGKVQSKDARYANGRSTRQTLLSDGEAKVIAKETSI